MSPVEAVVTLYDKFGKAMHQNSVQALDIRKGGFPKKVKYPGFDYSGYEVEVSTLVHKEGEETITFLSVCADAAGVNINKTISSTTSPPVDLNIYEEFSNISGYPGGKITLFARWIPEICS